MDRNNTFPIKILFLASDPSDATRLRLGQELREIRERLQLSKKRDNFVLESRESVRPGDITQAIFDVEPQIIHFSGHGLQTGELCFEDILGKVQVVKPEALATLFKLVADRVSCVILNACHSEIQANAIAKHIPFVIGMSQSIGDKAAIAFAVDAYEFACAEIQLYGISEHLTPIIFQSLTQNDRQESILRGIASSLLLVGGLDLLSAFFQAASDKPDRDRFERFFGSGISNRVIAIFPSAIPTEDPINPSFNSMKFPNAPKDAQDKRAKGAEYLVVSQDLDAALELADTFRSFGEEFKTELDNRHLNRVC
jgi:hypothetical protein